jgi:hypothetical protein
VVLVGLATYITYGNIYDNLGSSTITHHPITHYPKTTGEQGKTTSSGIVGSGKTAGGTAIKNLKAY